MKNLVIVESPAKAKTIEKFLGPDYTVMSSFGHIRDLQKKDFSVNTNGDFSPIYVIPDDKKDLVKKLKAAAKTADIVWLASDEDREGEAIAWHLYEVLGLTPEKARRIVFHEITKPAILHAIENPRHIDIDRVNAQQARRVLDRIVGFELSPVLWRKIKPALSAGRVQSVAVRLICEREKEINAFVTEPFFRINAVFRQKSNKPFRAELNHRLESEKEAADFLSFCSNASFKISDINVRPVSRSPQPPFTTSTLQQEASRRLGFSVNQTMSTAQKLYEEGHITYMRTDSVNLSDLALADMAKTISKTYGEQYAQTRRFHTHSKGAQEAHEAIRPTYVDKVSAGDTDREKKLYDLIRKRALASQMADAQLEKTGVEITITGTAGNSPETASGQPLFFKAEGEVIKFDGFLRAYAAEPGREEDILPALTQGEQLKEQEISATERFTQAPPRYNEGTLVKKMEELGIGRPSTYAPTISTIQTREYVKRGEKEGSPRQYLRLTLTPSGEIERQTLTENAGSEKGRLIPTDVGLIVNDFLTQYFPDILDYNFTAKVEEKFDDIAEGKAEWKDEISGFYGQFHPSIEEINNLRMEHKVGERVLGNDPKSGRPVSVKIGRFGPVVQIGEASDEEKPLFARLAEDQSISTITLEEALRLFELPRILGDLDGKQLKASVGRFGPYVQYGSMFVSIPKEMSPRTITFEEARGLIEAKQLEEANRIIKDFSEEMPGLQILNGRFGPYMAYKPQGARRAVNYKIPKELEPSEITFEKALEIKEAQDSAPKRTTRRTTKK